MEFVVEMILLIFENLVTHVSSNTFMPIVANHTIYFHGNTYI